MKKILIPFLFIAPVLAQAQHAGKEAEQIIITKKAGNNEKLNIVVDGDRVIVNGVPATGDKNNDVTVTRRKIKDVEVYAEETNPGNTHSYRYQYRLPAPQGVTVPNKAMLGVTTQKADDGVQVISITQESAAARAGLQEGDIILEIEREKITTPDDLSVAIRNKNPGDVVTIVYSRDGQRKTATATLTKWIAPPTATGIGSNGAPVDIEEFFRQMPNMKELPNVYGFRNNTSPFNNRPRLGIKVRDVETGKGVKIIDVQPGSAAAQAGLRVGDIITHINNTPVTDAAEVAGTIKEANSGDKIKMALERNGRAQSITVGLPRQLREADL